MDARAKRKRQQQTLLLGSVVFVLVGIVLAFLFLVMGGVSFKPKQETASTNTEATKESPSADAPKKKEPVSLIEAADLRMVIGNIPVRLVGMARGKNASSPQRKVAGKKKDEKPEEKKEEECLLITVEVKNPSAKDKLNFTTWSRDEKLRGALLTDGHGKQFAAKSIQVSSILGREVPDTVPPGGTVRDILAFELPDAATTKLELELPGEPFGMNAAANFPILMELLSDKTVVVRIIPTVNLTTEDGKPATADGKPGSAKAKKKRPPPKPGTPEYDFGIEEEDSSSPH
jgi:hypothetical protein